MKKIYLILVAIFLLNFVKAQNHINTEPKVEQPTYIRIPEIPPFDITLVSDSTAFAKADLPKKKKTLMFIFSPTCSHCLQAIDSITTNYNNFKHVNIVMATITDYFITKKFYEDRNLKNYPNIKMGIDTKYFLGTFYGIKMYPALFLYDKKGMFKHRFDTKDSMEVVARKL